MATQFDAGGLQDLRSYIQTNWNFIAIVDDLGNEVLRWEIPDHAGTSWISNFSNNPVKAELIITGQDLQDEGESLPVTLARSESYKSATGTSRMTHDPFPDIEVEVPNDEVTIVHNYRVPQ